MNKNIITGAICILVLVSLSIYQLLHFSESDSDYYFKVEMSINPDFIIDKDNFTSRLKESKEITTFLLDKSLILDECDWSPAIKIQGGLYHLTWISYEAEFSTNLQDEENKNTLYELIYKVADPNLVKTMSDQDVDEVSQ